MTLFPVSLSFVLKNGRISGIVVRALNSMPSTEFWVLHYSGHIKILIPVMMITQTKLQNLYHLSQTYSKTILNQFHSDYAQRVYQQDNNSPCSNVLA